MNSMADSRQASWALFQTAAHRILRYTKTTIISASQTPAAAASVAVNTPAYIPPSTNTGSISDQTDLRRACLNSEPLARVSRAIFLLLRNTDHDISTVAIIRPGIIPAVNKPPMEESVVIP